jgi:hypothetical protein
MGVTVLAVGRGVVAMGVVAMGVVAMGAGVTHENHGCTHPSHYRCSWLWVFMAVGVCTVWLWVLWYHDGCS